MLHHDDRGKKRKRDRDKGNQGGAHIAQEGEQDDEDEYGSDGEGITQIAERALDEIGRAVHRRIDGDAFRFKARDQFRKRRLQPVGRVHGVGAELA